MKKPVVKQRLFTRIMKITLFQFVLAFVFSSFALANNVAGQGKLDTKITITISDMNLSSALSKIEKKVNVKFSYNSRMTKLNKLFFKKKSLWMKIQMQIKHKKIN
jgi:iron complex outermembrane receptor protein